MGTRVVYHGTDIKGLNRIFKERVLRGDPNVPIYGVGLCLTISRARGFVCIKALRNTRRCGRVVRLVVDEALLAHTTPEPTGDCFTVDSKPGRPMRELSLDDPRVLSFEVLTLKQQQKLVHAEFEGGVR